MKKLLSIALLGLFGLSVTVLAAAPIVLQKNYPERYVVKQGDTLWGIANKVLKKPWQWKALWKANPHIKMPDRLKVGDVLMLQAQRAPNQPALHYLPNRTVKLSPHTADVSASMDAIPPIPLSEILPFLSGMRILSPEAMKQAPYIAAMRRQHIYATPDDLIYVRGFHLIKQAEYGIFHNTYTYRDPKSKKILGYEMKIVGQGKIKSIGKTTVMSLSDVAREINVNDKILPRTPRYLAAYFVPSEPSHAVHGKILRILNGSFRYTGPNYVVSLNLGKDAGIRTGNVLSIESPAKKLEDKVTKKMIEVPAEPMGHLMVFRVFDHISYGLVTDAKDMVETGDAVMDPV